jgi:hypothetical protein
MVLNSFVFVLQFEKRKNNVLIHSVDSSSNKPATQQPPVESKREQEKPAAGVENRKDPIKPARETFKPLVKESKEKASAAPVREWDRHKLRQSRSVSRERLRKEDRAKVEGRDKREPSRHEQQRSRDDRRGRGRTDKPGNFMSTHYHGSLHLQYISRRYHVIFEPV